MTAASQPGGDGQQWMEVPEPRLGGEQDSHRLQSSSARPRAAWRESDDPVEIDATAYARGGAVVSRGTSVGVVSTSCDRPGGRPSAARRPTARWPISSRGWSTVVSEMWARRAKNVLS